MNIQITAVGRLVSISYVIVFLWLSSTIYGCGLDWRLPINHFNDIDERGHISCWKDIGNVDCGGGLALPLYINFNSKRDTGDSSPYLGQGWLMPLLESKFIQEDDDRFVMIQPDGLNNVFLRMQPNGNILNGSAGWKGEIDNGTITAWASCGWKLVFVNGHITKMTTPKSRQIDWVYEGGHVTELREGSTTYLKVEYSGGHVQALNLGGGKRILVAEDKKPRLQAVAGQNVISGVDNSLSEMTLVDGQKLHFTFGADDNALPTLKMSKDSVDGVPSDVKQFEWNPQTKFVSRDNDWSYRITPSVDPHDAAAIERTDDQGRKEYWFRDNANGTETTLSKDGIKKIKYWFTSGILAGKTKKIEEITSGERHVIFQASYDEKGGLLREVDGFGRIKQFHQDAKGNHLIIYARNVMTPEMAAELQVKEKLLASKIESTSSMDARDNAIQTLAFFYIQYGDLAKAKALVSNIAGRQCQFNVLVQIAQASANENTKTMDETYTNLLNEYPEQRTLLTRLSQLRH